MVSKDVMEGVLEEHETFCISDRVCSDDVIPLMQIMELRRIGDHLSDLVDVSDKYGRFE